MINYGVWFNLTNAPQRILVQRPLLRGELWTWSLSVWLSSCRNLKVTSLSLPNGKYFPSLRHPRKPQGHATTSFYLAQHIYSWTFGRWWSPTKTTTTRCSMATNEATLWFPPFCWLSSMNAIVLEQSQSWSAEKQMIHYDDRWLKRNV